MGADLQIPDEAKRCIECHKKKQISNIALRDWQFSAHAERGVTCTECHIPVSEASKEITEGNTLCDNKDVRRSVSPKNCEWCHPDQTAQFALGKHSRAWATLQDLHNTNEISKAFKIEEDCSGCHRIGRDDGKCDSCHTRHRFAASEARRPEACQTCHMGPAHPQWETFSTSKHGSIYSIEGQDWYWEKRIAEWYKSPLIESPVIPRAPVCATCHMPEGNHAVDAASGFWGIPPSGDDPEQQKNREKFFMTLGFLDETGGIVEGFTIIKEDDAPLSKEHWKDQRERMIKICSQCHTSSFSKDTLIKADNTVKACDELLIKAANIVEGLYTDNIIQKRKRLFPHIDILRFEDFKNPIEERLFGMLVEHKMKTYMGAFHINPAYQHDYGLAEMKRDLREIENMADNLRKEGSEK